MSIGILKAVGYSDITILIHYMKYSFLIGFIGSVLGIFLGLQLAAALAGIYLEYGFDIPVLEAKIYPFYVISGILISSFFTILAGAWGARSIMKINPAEAMR